MGAVYHSYAVVGVKIDPERLVTTKKVRGCQCEKTPTGHFCSSCGEPAFIEEDECIEGYNEDEDIYGYKIIFGTDHNEAFIAAIVCKDDDYGDSKNFSQMPTELERIKNDMRNTLDPIGLWDEKKFGLWSVLYCSY